MANLRTSLEVFVTANTNRFKRQMAGMARGVRQATQGFRRMNQEMRKTRRASSFAGRAVNRFGADLARLTTGFYAVQRAGRDFVGLLQRIQESENALRVSTDSVEQLGQAYKDLLSVSARTQTPFLDNIAVFRRIAIATEDVNVGYAEQVRLVELLAKASVTGGSTASERRGALTQFSQGLASNRLSGDELRSVLENIPLVPRAIAKGLGIGIGPLRELGQAGGLTTDVVVKALLSQGKEIDEAFKETTRTITRATNDFRNEFTNFVKVLEEFASVGESIIVILTGAAEVLRVISSGNLWERFKAWWLDFYSLFDGVENDGLSFDLRAELEARVTGWFYAVLGAAGVAIGAILTRVANFFGAAKQLGPIIAQLEAVEKLRIQGVKVVPKAGTANLDDVVERLNQRQAAGRAYGQSLKKIGRGAARFATGPIGVPLIAYQAYDFLDDQFTGILEGYFERRGLNQHNLLDYGPVVGLPTADDIFTDPQESKRIIEGLREAEDARQEDFYAAQVNLVKELDGLKSYRRRLSDFGGDVSQVNLQITRLEKLQEDLEEASQSIGRRNASINNALDAVNEELGLQGGKYVPEREFQRFDVLSGPDPRDDLQHRANLLNEKLIAALEASNTLAQQEYTRRVTAGYDPLSSIVSDDTQVQLAMFREELERIGEEAERAAEDTAQYKEEVKALGKSIAETLVDGLREGASAAQIFGDIASQILDRIIQKAITDPLSDAIGDFLGSVIFNGIPGLGEAPAAASGGRIARGGFVRVGEAGPELVALPSGAVVHPRGNLMEGGSRPLVINVNGVQDPAVVRREIERMYPEIQRVVSGGIIQDVVRPSPLRRAIG